MYRIFAFLVLTLYSFSATSQISVSQNILSDTTINCESGDPFSVAEIIFLEFFNTPGNVTTTCDDEMVSWGEGFYDPSVFDISCGEVTVEFNLYDNCGYTEYVSVPVHLLDTVPPTFNLPLDQHGNYRDSIQCSDFLNIHFWVSEMTFLATDNCADETAGLLVESDCGICSVDCGSSIDVEFTLDDGCNISEFTFTVVLIEDADLDGVDDDEDNCPNSPNPDQEDEDDDGIGDVCDPVNNLDVDGDDILLGEDNCPNTYNPGQEDKDDDNIGDACDDINDIDFDEDGILNENDNCPNIINPGQENKDGDELGDACDTVNDIDFDEDGILNENDNCPNVINPGQEDIDNDGFGNLCDDINELRPFVTISENIYLEQSYTGIILKAQNGSCWIITANNDGTLATLSVECPN